MPAVESCSAIMYLEETPAIVRKNQYGLFKIGRDKTSLPTKCKIVKTKTVQIPLMPFTVHLK